MVRVYVRARGARPLQLYFYDPFTKREVSKSAGTTDRREAEREAARWEAELLAYRGEASDGWKFFRDRFRDEHLATLSKASTRSFGTALNHYQRLMDPARISDVTANTVSVFQAKLIGERRKLTSIANYLKHVKAALGWAKQVGLIAEVPNVRMPRQVRRSFMRSRPVTEPEYRAMLKHAAECGPEWKRMLELLWLSGLRLSEAMRLSWDRQPIVVDIEHQPYPQILYYAEGHKARRDDAVPMVPDLHAWLAKTPQRARWGLVAPLPITAQREVSKQLTAFGQAAGVVVNEDGKFASAHDMRRAFGTRWSQKVMPPVLQKLMRHADIQTTLRYYVSIQATDIGAALWGVPNRVPKTRSKRASAG